MSTNPQTPPLIFQPLDINSMRLENRILLPAMVTRLSGEDGYVNGDIRDRYIRFALGEPGLIIIEAMAVHEAKSGPLLRIGNDSYMQGLRDLCRDMKAVSPSRVVPQIIHFLKIARSGWRQKISDLSVEDIKLIIEQYSTAAARVRECGFDGVELHMAHAYTLSSFLSAMNKRADEYGGTLENRMRAMSEAITEVRGKVGADFPIGVRFDGEECIKNGYTTDDSRKMALRMAQLGVDYISVSAGGKFEDAIHKQGEPLYPYTGYSGDRCMPGRTYPDGANIYIAAGIKSYLRERGYNHVPVATTGKIRTAEHGEQVLQQGNADIIGMARALLADPDLPRKSRDGHAEKVVGCIYGNVCKSLDENFRKVVCVLWQKVGLQAPLSNDEEAPQWAVEGAGLQARFERGRVVLSWKEATDNERIYGYEIFRAEGDDDFERITAGQRTLFYDKTAVSGAAYRYFVRAYDLAGNRSPDSEVVMVDVGLSLAAEPGSAHVAALD